MNSQIKECHLSNGLKILIKEVHAAPVASLWIFYRVGSRCEKPGFTGISHWVEHMLFKGTPKIAKGAIPKMIRKYGGSLNGQTSHDYTLYYETLPKEQLEIALRIESDRMVNSLFSPEEVELERTVILAELEGAENYPQTHLRFAVQATAYQIHPYRLPVIGYRGDLESITREDLLKHYHSYYAPNNAVVVAVGDLKTEEFLDQMKSYFGNISPRGIPTERKSVEPIQSGEKRIKIEKKGNTAYILMAYHIPPLSDSDLYALQLLDTLLSHGRSSRLYQGLVEKGIATSAWSSVRALAEPGLMYLGVTLQNQVSLQKAEELLNLEIEKVKSEALTEVDFKRALNQLEADFIFSQDSVSQQARQVGIYEMLHSYKYMETFLTNIRKVSRDEVQYVANKYLIESNRTIGWLIPQ